MKLDLVASSKNDEYYTPEYAITPIVKYLKNRSFNKIWCPFDTSESLFVKVLEKNCFEVRHSHIANGQNFFNMSEIEWCECVVSNPPYSIKGDVLSALFNAKKPFAMLVGVVGIFESERRFSMFNENDFEILYLNRRVSYLKSYKDNNTSLNPPFQSVYITSGVLPKQICFERIKRC